MTLVPMQSSTMPDDLVDTFVTLRLQGQLIGLPIDQVKDVFHIHSVTPVPLSHAAMAGLTNVRGRIIMVFSLAGLMGLAQAGDERQKLAVGVTWRGETCGVLTDTVGDVIRLPARLGENPPRTLSAAWARHARRVFALQSELMIELDMNSLLDMSPVAAA